MSSTRRAFLATALSGVAAACANPPVVVRRAPPVPGLDALLDRQSRIYPLIGSDDLYKLVYQAVMGPAWFYIGQESSVESGLLAEIRQMEPAIHDGEQEIEMLCEDRNLVRVNLRPFLQRGGKAVELAHALCATTQYYRGDLAEIESSLEAAGAALPRLGLACDPKEYRSVVQQMARANYRPGVHSEAYALAYRPAYRIIQLHFLTDPQYGGRDVGAPSSPMSRGSTG